RALSSIASALQQAGHTEQALAAAREISSESFRSEALSSIASGLQQAGQIEAAKAGWSGALTVADAITNVDKRSELHAQIAGGFALLRDFRRAREIADRCKDPGDRLSAYVAILRAYMEKAEPPAAGAAADTTKQMTGK
ncbi:hypothetical protein IIA29_12500, partial [candidate division KSB1 bacterium]|nr:hypothetical protein [candidate division KSB1 bacterium]